MDFSIPPVAVHLHKVIPMGAGLGGGSADGAFMLLLLNQLFQLNLSNDSLIGYALKIGSDCPFFILNKPAYATGRGEILEPLGVPALNGKKILLVCPGIHINTGWAFNQLQMVNEHPYLPSLIQEPLEKWESLLGNDFEPVVFKAYPQLKSIQENLYSAGAVYAGMTGSGSTIFGIFDTLPTDYSKYFDLSCKLIPV
jgi:4-diphosphocytidyl-2-C-methyl-D-erythritol kinase